MIRGPERPPDAPNAFHETAFEARQLRSEGSLMDGSEGLCAGSPC